MWRRKPGAAAGSPSFGHRTRKGNEGKDRPGHAISPGTHLGKAQQAQQRHYNRATQPREFHPGDRVMVLVPTAACKFLATWQGPYTVLEKIGPVTYRVRQPGRRKNGAAVPRQLAEKVGLGLGTSSSPSPLQNPWW